MGYAALTHPTTRGYARGRFFLIILRRHGVRDLSYLVAQFDRLHHFHFGAKPQQFRRCMPQRLADRQFAIRQPSASAVSSMRIRAFT